MSTIINFKTTGSQPFIIVPTCINNSGPFDLVLDTGANITILSEEASSLLTLKNIETKNGIGGGGKQVSVKVGQADSISVGNIKVRNPKIGIMKTLPKCIGQGVIGYDFLKHFVLTIDYPKNELILSESEDSGTIDLTNVLPLKLAKPDRPVIIVDGIVNNTNTFPFILDTGASQTVISSFLAEKIGVRTSQKDIIIVADGDVPGFCGTLNSLVIGSAIIENLSVFVTEIFTAFYESTGIQTDGILGYNFLSNFRITIDYQNKKLQLR